MQMQLRSMEKSHIPGDEVKVGKIKIKDTQKLLIFQVTVQLPLHTGSLP